MRNISNSVPSCAVQEIKSNQIGVCISEKTGEIIIIKNNYNEAYGVHIMRMSISRKSRHELARIINNMYPGKELIYLDEGDCFYMEEGKYFLPIALSI